MECRAITNTGTQCSRIAEPDSKYCWQHQNYETKIDNESELIPELEELMSEYADLETYIKLIQYNPTKYNIGKYETLIASTETKIQNEKLDVINKEIASWKEYGGDKSIRPLLEDLMNSKSDLLFGNIESILGIMNQLGYVEYWGTEGVETSFGPKATTSITVKILSNPPTYDDLVGKDVILELSEDRKQLIFKYMDSDDDTEYPLKLTPLWNLLYNNILLFVESISYE